MYFLGIQPSIDQQISQKGHESQNQVYTIMTMINDFVGRLWNGLMMINGMDNDD